MKNINYFILFVALSLFVISSNAQSGGSYQITQSVIAAGGQNSTGGSFSLDGTIGQTLAGEDSTGSMFSVSSGFWLPQLAPTAAAVSISGRIMTGGGRGIRNVSIILTNSATGENRFVRSSAFGFYRFEDVTVGQSYILTVNAKRFQFNPNTRFINLFESLTDANFVGSDRN